MIDPAGKVGVLVVHAQIQILAWRRRRHRARGFAASIGALATDRAKVDRCAASRKEATRLLTLRSARCYAPRHACHLHGRPRIRDADLKRHRRAGPRRRRRLHARAEAGGPARARSRQDACSSARRGLVSARRDDRDAAHRSKRKPSSAPSRRMSRSSPPMGSSSRLPCSPRRSSAASTFMPRCCRAGAARRRCSARSWPATPRPASTSCAWRKGSTPARWRASFARRSARATPPATSRRSSPRSAPR